MAFVKKISGGGNVVDMGVHVLDLIEFMLGEIEKIEVIKSNNMKLYKVEDVCIINFKLTNKVWVRVLGVLYQIKKLIDLAYLEQGLNSFFNESGENELIEIIKNGKKNQKNKKSNLA